ncbi:MAG: DoxX family protein [Flavipsychrobacter sp.]|nr:DoxX family protein [Flavipsychrobacter sp.]
MSKTRKIIGWLLTALLAFAFIGSGIMKFTLAPEMLAKAATWGITASTIKIIATIEILSAVIFIIPRTGIVGTLLLAAYMGGAIATHLEHNDNVMVPVVLESLIWITALLRFPELGSRLFSSKK